MKQVYSGNIRGGISKEEIGVCSQQRPPCPCFFISPNEKRLVLSITHWWMWIRVAKVPIKNFETPLVIHQINSTTPSPNSSSSGVAFLFYINVVLCDSFPDPPTVSSSRLLHLASVNIVFVTPIVDSLFSRPSLGHRLWLLHTTNLSKAHHDFPLILDIVDLRRGTF